MTTPITQTSPSGGAPGATTQAVPAPPVVVHVSQAEKSSAVMRAIGQFGTAENALLNTLGKQIHYQKRAQEAERQLADAIAKVPPTGAVVLTGDEAKTYTELKGKGVELVKVPTLLKEASDLAAKASAEARTASISAASGKAYKEKVLKLLIGDKELSFKDTLVKGDDGKTTTEKVPYIKVGDTVEPLQTWLEREHDKDTLDLLSADPNAPASTQSGITMPTQSRSSAPSGPGPANDVVNQTLGSRYQTPGQRRAAQQTGGAK